jgi:plasmid maintenance system antidote protein VapI
MRMATETGSILVGFYLTHSNSVRRVLKVDGKTVTEVVRGKRPVTTSAQNPLADV